MGGEKLNLKADRVCLNPYFLGITTLGAQPDGGREHPAGLNPYFLGITTLGAGLSEIIDVDTRLNPYFLGITTLGPFRPPQTAERQNVLILIFLE